MKLPKKLMILGQEFKIKEKPQKEIEKMLGQGTFGAMNYSDKLILIASDANELDKLLIFLHECGHAITHVNGLNQVMSPELQEVMVESFANGAIEIMKQLAKPVRRKKQSKYGSRKKQRGAA